MERLLVGARQRMGKIVFLHQSPQVRNNDGSLQHHISLLLEVPGRYTGDNQVMPASISRWTSCGLCPKVSWISHLAPKDLYFCSVLFFSHCKRIFFDQFISKIKVIYGASGGTGRKCPTTSSFHPNLQCVVVNCIHIFQKECFLGKDWRGMIY